jgi:predicted small secreted protein
MTSSKLILLGAMICTLSLGACGNTFEGAGRDIERSGEWIQNTF